MIIDRMTTASPSPGSPYSLNGIAPVPHLGVIRTVGADAATFLQGQLTQDFLLLKMDRARLAAFCSAKGRMQASFVGFKRSSDQAATEGTGEPAPEILLICSRDILAATLKRLSMFVLRAKVKLTDATDEFALLGLAGDTLKKIANNQGGAGTLSTFGAENVISLHPAGDVARALWLAPSGTQLPGGPALTTELWQWGEVRSGVATITTPIVDAFVPQMLNYESVGGVNFKKGCYPGQEVVARSQFRGTLKRRAYLVHCEQPMKAGDEVFGPADAQQACGTVAQAAPVPFTSGYGGFDAIVSMQVAAATAGGLTLASATGPAISLDTLPYALLEDV